MASGRMLQRSISNSKHIPALIDAVEARLGEPHGERAALLFTWLIPYLDSAGRCNADAAVVKGQVVPRLKKIREDDIPVYLEEMARVGLVDYYDADGDAWLSFPGFDRNQPNLRKDREASSKIPPPSAGIPRAAPNAISCATPAQRRSDAGVSPAEEKRSEVKESRQEREPARARVIGAPTAEGFVAIWGAKTGELMPSGFWISEVRSNLEQYAEATGQTFAIVADAAHEAFVEEVSGWRVKRPLTAKLFCDKWAEIQSRMGGKVPRGGASVTDGKTDKKLKELFR